MTPCHDQTAEEMLVRVGAERTGVQLPYEKPYTVLERLPKYFIINKKTTPMTVNRLKVFHKTQEQTPAVNPLINSGEPAEFSAKVGREHIRHTTRSGRTSRRPTRYDD